ncbi:D-aminoacyl-tRNA deacylase [Nitratifractor salsuginis]|uniref:D-aminoacyl-tRNA deacylase n=1 Tax=Nitratifractor salsuginis (strain DSM 16511 / JCM 12458 / E9I37-1) TaxID=749222 RepID=E6WZK3_NITSE|nr:D-aminoacyl-tRNA deacylase [Nitratifractor salsuginis]ADV45583.1 D-tyrosyl-tRNA(Tyr) deacylase [Nitratifractor salsuginis DSM 16511]
MIAVLQRVSRSLVRVDGEVVGEIGRGMNILLGVVKEDTRKDIDKLIAKIPHLRIFPDEEGRMNRSLIDCGGSALVISQFTLAANVKKGRRPSFERAMVPEEARELYEAFCEALAEYVPVERGIFGAMMEVEIHNDGPVTLILDSREL